MQVVFKLGYSLVVAIMLVLSVILGVRTFYPEPEGPPFPEEPFAFEPFPAEPIFCEPDGRCFNERTGQEVTEEEAQQAQQEFDREIREFEQGMREFEEKRETFISDERAPYHRNVFILASAIGVAAVAAGLYLVRRVEAMPLGLMLGGLGVIIYGWARAAEDFGEIGEAPLFASITVGLAVVLAAGYWFIGPRSATNGAGQQQSR